MKIRTDFVTNSSSSSFIVGFKSEDSIEDEIRANMHTEGEVGYAGFYRKDSFIESLTRECMDEDNKASKEEAIEAFTTYKEWETSFDVRQNYSATMGYMAAWEFVHSPEGEIEVQKEFNKKLDEFKKKLDDPNYKELRIVTYSDNNGDFHEIMEHTVMPNFPNTLATLNGH